MTIMEFFLVEVKVLERGGAFRAVPGIVEQHSSDIPEQGANGRQRMVPPRKVLGKSLDEKE